MIETRNIGSNYVYVGDAPKQTQTSPRKEWKNKNEIKYIFYVKYIRDFILNNLSAILLIIECGYRHKSFFMMKRVKIFS